ncbi:MAG: ABC transporter permease [Saprospiraceae bacterium]|nr:ABC transporter permease [Saprospiraceae bacterium]
MKQFKAFVQKEFLHVFRDPKTLLMLFGVPVMLILLFGFALTNELKNSKIVICDFAHDEASRDITERLSAGGIFIVGQTISDYTKIEETFKAGNIKLAILFPAGLYDNLMHQHKAQVRIIADASDPNSAATLTGYATNIIMEYQRDLLKEAEMPMQIIPEIRMLYNPELKGATNFVPGVMALVLMLICVLMTSVSIVREKELGTMDILLASPVNPFLVIISKAIPYLFLSIINLIAILLLSTTLLDMPIRGSILLLLGESILLIITALSLGLLISNVVQSQQAAMLTSMMGMLVPTMLFTGFLFPIENMPVALQVISNIVPAKWYYTIVKAIMIKGLGIAAIWKETMVLAGMTILLLLISFKKFKRRLE